MDDLSQIAIALLSLIGGLFGGYIIEHYRLKHELKIEKTKRLAPHLEQVYPTLKNLNTDSSYAVELQNRGAQDDELLGKICGGLKEFATWYHVFKQNGFEPELESLDEHLYRLFLGVFTYSQLSSKYDVTYISQRLDHVHSICSVCRKSLEKLLKG